MCVLKKITATSTQQRKVWAVDHDAKYGNPPSITVMIYSLGTAVITIENRGDGWRLKSKTLAQMYSTIPWDFETVFENSEEGAVALATLYIDAITNVDEELRKKRA